MEKKVDLQLWERGDWVTHDILEEPAKRAVIDIINQLDEPLNWLCHGLTSHQLDELLECGKVEMRERERARNQPQNARVRILGEL